MLAGKRSIRVGDQILKELAEFIAKKVRDPRVNGVTLTGIRMSNDLKHARIFYSFMGDEKEIARIQAGLDSAKGFIKRHLGQKVALRYIPDIIFQYDPTLEMGNQIEKLFQKILKDESKNSNE